LQIDMMQRWESADEQERAVYESCFFQYQWNRCSYAEYGLTHHSNMDSNERLVEENLKRTAVIVAGFVWHTAMLDERPPRKP